MLCLAPCTLGCGLLSDIRAVPPPLSNKAISQGTPKHLPSDKIKFRSDNHIKPKAVPLCEIVPGIYGMEEEFYGDTGESVTLHKQYERNPQNNLAAVERERDGTL